MKNVFFRPRGCSALERIRQGQIKNHSKLPANPQQVQEHCRSSCLRRRTPGFISDISIIMRLSPVFKHLLVFISVQSFKAGVQTTATADPCYNYTALDDPWRSPDNRYPPQYMCDYYVSWNGWYRLFIHGQSVQMPDTCVDENSCGTDAPLWLNGAHPTVEDGVVSRDVCISWRNNCCHAHSNPINVKACPGGYYVYEFVMPIGCYFTYCAGQGIFYSFGWAVRDTNNPADGNSSVIQLSSPFLFFGRTYQQIYVNNNGLLTFNQSSSAYIPYSFPANRNQDIIAGLWTDLDNRVKGVVSYNQYTSGNVLTNATRDINTYFPKLNFNASWVFVATWNKVAYFNLTSTDTSFQVVLISDRNSSFILMNYGDIAVTEHPVQAGYDTINSTHYFVIPGSNRGSFISNLRNSSNVDVPGRWAFMVAGEPDNVIGIQVRLSSFSDLTQSSNIEMVLQQMKQELVKYGLPNSVELKLRKRQKIKP
uniref:Si:ch73-329n5.1 n=1 Tax=Cyprinus carpio TaxID=7962 RepID=A0A8C2DIR5_CYPCA